MAWWLVALIIYGVAFGVWVIICAIAWLISVIAKRNALVALEAVSGVLVWILGFGAGIADIVFVVQLFTNGHIFWGIVAILLGFGLITFIANILVMPFGLVLSAFDTWYESIEQGESTNTYIESEEEIDSDLDDF